MSRREKTKKRRGRGGERAGEIKEKAGKEM